MSLIEIGGLLIVAGIAIAILVSWSLGVLSIIVGLAFIIWAAVRGRRV